MCRCAKHYDTIGVSKWLITILPFAVRVAPDAVGVAADAEVAAAAVDAAAVATTVDPEPSATEESSPTAFSPSPGCCRRKGLAARQPRFPRLCNKEEDYIVQVCAQLSDHSALQQAEQFHRCYLRLCTEVS